MNNIGSESNQGKNFSDNIFSVSLNDLDLMDKTDGREGWALVACVKECSTWNLHSLVKESRESNVERYKSSLHKSYIIGTGLRGGRPVTLKCGSVRGTQHCAKGTLHCTAETSLLHAALGCYSGCKLHKRRLRVIG